MSRITDLVDQAGADAAPPPVTPRAVVATDTADADAVWRAFSADAGFDMAASEQDPGGLTRLYVPVRSGVHVDGGEPRPASKAGTPPLLGDYRGHPVHVPGLPAGRVLLHALRLLEEDPLSDMDGAARDATCAAALAYALAQEALGTLWASRLSAEAVETYLASDPAQLSPPPSPAGQPPPLDALLVLDAAQGAIATANVGLPLVLLRAGRPALLAVVGGEHSASAALLIKLVVATLDLGETLGATLARMGTTLPAMAMMLDERGTFQAGSTAATTIHVRGYERDEAS